MSGDPFHAVESRIPPDVRAAMARILELAEAFEEDEARTAFEQLSSQVAGDRELAITTHRTLANELSKAGNDELTALARRATLASADEPRWLELAIEAAVGFVSDCRDEEADALIAEVAARTSHDPALAFSTRLQFVGALEKAWHRTRATKELRAMLELELSDTQRLEVLTKLASVERGSVTEALATLLAAVSSATPIDLRVRGHLELAAGDTSLAMRHAALAADLAAHSTDLNLRRRARAFYAEQLFDAGELARAENLVASLPAAVGETEEDVDWQAVAPRALLEHIGRRRGTLAEPPPEAFAERPGDVPGTRSTLPEGFRAYFTPAADPLSLIHARGLVSPDKVREWSYGSIKTADDLESERIFGPLRTYACRCERFLGNAYAGIVCHRCGVEVVVRGQRAVRPGHLTLRRPVVHPWFVPVVARVLNLPQPELKATDGAEVLEELDRVHLPSLAEELRAELEHSLSGARRAALTPRLAIVESLLEAELRPQWCVLEVLPVWPPEAELPAGLERSAVRSAYVELLDAEEAVPAVRRLFNSFVP